MCVCVCARAFSWFEINKTGISRTLCRRRRCLPHHLPFVGRMSDMVCIQQLKIDIEDVLCVFNIVYLCVRSGLSRSSFAKSAGVAVFDVRKSVNIQWNAAKDGAEIPMIIIIIRRELCNTDEPIMNVKQCGLHCILTVTRCGYMCVAMAVDTEHTLCVIV